jgi:hypothetical protein
LFHRQLQRNFAPILMRVNTVHSLIAQLLRAKFRVCDEQINLKVKICKGSSVRKALVREASLFGASKLVLGITKKKRSIG